MAGCYLWYERRALTESEQAARRAAMLGLLSPRPEDHVETLTSSNVVGLVIHHGCRRSWGASSSDSGRFRLLLGGNAAIHGRGERFCTPEDAVQVIAAGLGSGRPLFEGQYLAVVADAQEQRILVETDLLGVLPCYYKATADGVLISSELKLFRALRPRSVDRAAVAEFIRFGHVMSERTLIAGVKRLPPNHRLVFDGELRLEPFPLPQFPRNRPLTDDVIDELDDAFKGYLNRVSDLGRSVSVSLSGGLDSRLIAAVLADRGFKMVAFSAGVPGSLECRVAARFAAELGIEHHVHTFDGRRLPSWFEQAMWVTEGRCPAGHMHFLDAMSAGDYPPFPQFHGLLGDHVIGGDLDHNDPRAVEANYESACRAYLRSIYWPRRSLEAVLGEGLAHMTKTVDSELLAAIAAKNPMTGTYPGFLWFRYLTRAWGFVMPALASQVLPWVDLFTPYMSREFFDVSAGIRHRDILDRRAQVRWAVTRYPVTGAIPRVKDGVLVPLELDRNVYDRRVRYLLRKKRMRYLATRLSQGRINPAERESYPNYGQWYRKWPGVRQFVGDILLSRRSLERGLWDEGGLRSLLRDLRIGRNVWDAVGSVLQLETLMRAFIDDRGDA